MNPEKQHPTVEEILAEEKAAKRLRIRQKAFLAVCCLPVVFIAFIWAGVLFPNIIGGLMGTAAVLAISGVAAMAFATEGLESLPW